MNRAERRRIERDHVRGLARAAGDASYDDYVVSKQQRTALARRAQTQSKVAARCAGFVLAHVPVWARRVARWVCPPAYERLIGILYNDVPSVIFTALAREGRSAFVANMVVWFYVSALTVLAVLLYTPLAWLKEQFLHWGYHIRRRERMKPGGVSGHIELRIRTWGYKTLLEESHPW